VRSRLTWIKICGTTSLEDAEIAVEAGADALGFIFAKSPRQITPENAAEIIANLDSGIIKVGVFVAEPWPQILEIAKQANLDAVQLHGPQQLVQAAALKSARPELKITIAIPGREDRLRGFKGEPRKQPFDWLMLDNDGGGTGRLFEWDAAADAVKDIRQHLQLIIAGGLTRENVGEAIRLFRPFGVDVVTGVEGAPGKKDPDKVRAFIQAVREADRRH
jgi:phosphoribosylanthranilate isomerase